MRQRLDDPLRFSERGEDVLIESFVAQAASEALDEGVLHRLAGRDVVPLDLVLGGQGSTALPVSSVPVSETIIAGLPRTAMMASRSRITGRPDSVRYRRQEPEPSSIPKLITDSNDQRWFSACGTAIGARVPMARRRPR